MDEYEYWNARDDDAGELHALNLITAQLKKDYWKMKLRKLKEGEKIELE